MNNEVSARVALLVRPKKLLRTVYTACKTCYSAEDPEDIWNDSKIDRECAHFFKDGDAYIDKEEKMLKLIKKVMDAGHFSVLEHANFTFSISGISRALSHQLVRHRIGTAISQKSQRYVTYKSSFKYIVPPKIMNSKLYEEYKNHMAKTQELYNAFVAEGIPAEDARYIFPNACETSMTFSCNLRELIHIANLRLCTSAQHEIRNLVGLMTKLVIEKEEWLSSYLVPKCEKNGYCDEITSCGRCKVRKIK